MYVCIKIWSNRLAMFLGPKSRDAVTLPFQCAPCGVLHLMCTARFLIFCYRLLTNTNTNTNTNVILRLLLEQK